MAKTPALRVPGETGLTLIAPIVGREEQATDDTHNHYEQQRYHFSSRSNRPRMNETSETSVFNLL